MHKNKKYNKAYSCIQWLAIRKLIAIATLKNFASMQGLAKIYSYSIMYNSITFGVIASYLSSSCSAEMFTRILTASQIMHACMHFCEKDRCARETVYIRS